MPEKNVLREEAGQRIDSWLEKSFPEHSRTFWRRLIDQGEIAVNRQPVKANYRLRENDEVTYVIPPAQPLAVQPVKMDLDIMYEDADLLVINKPKGLVVHPGAGTVEPTLVSGLLAHCDDLSGINGVQRPGIVHRIDKNTSGLLIVAKNDHAHQGLAAQLADKTLSRKYLALVYGTIDPDEGTIDAPIGRDPWQRTKMTVRAVDAKPAVTEFTVRKRYRGYTLVECRLKTGRTHQIRVHFRYIGHPIVGDPQYSGRVSELADTQLLHAYHIEFIHPTTGKRMSFEAPLPEEFRKVLEELDEREEHLK